MESYLFYSIKKVIIIKLGFLFGAGAEVGYNLPLGSKFALDIFRYDNIIISRLCLSMKMDMNTSQRHSGFII